MGIVCTSCSRKTKDNDDVMLSSTERQNKSKNLFKVFEMKRGDDAINLNCLKKENQLTLVLNSASNYWSHRDKMTLFGSHRPISTYKTPEMSKLVRVNNSIITLEVLYFYCF